jgi:3-oxoadipate enol-lactonase
VVYSPAYIEAHRDERAMRRKQIAALPERWFSDLVGLLDSAASFSLGDELGEISCPTLVVAAGLDGFIPRERCRALADAIPNADFRVIEGAGHAVVVERPDAVVALAREFFAR